MPLQQEAKSPKSANATAAYLIPLMSILAVRIVMRPFAPGISHPSRMLAGAAAIWFFRKSYVEFRFSWHWAPIAFGTGTAMAWMILARSGSATGPQAVPSGWGTVELLFRTIEYVLVVPVAEELAFRGYLARRLMSADFLQVPASRISGFAILVSSVLFGLMHGPNWLPGTIAGLLYVSALLARGRLADAVEAHSTTNALVAVYALVSHDWSNWS